MKKENWEFIKHIFVSNFLTSEVFCKKEKYVLENFMDWEIFYGTHTIEVGKFQSWEFLWEFKVKRKNIFSVQMWEIYVIMVKKTFPILLSKNNKVISNGYSYYMVKI